MMMQDVSAKYVKTANPVISIEKKQYMIADGSVKTCFTEYPNWFG
jgi:hypothetical protein